MQVNIDGSPNIIITPYYLGLQFKIERDGMVVQGTIRAYEGRVEFSIFPGTVPFTEEVIPGYFSLMEGSPEIFIRIGEEPEGEE